VSGAPRRAEAGENAPNLRLAQPRPAACAGSEDGLAMAGRRGGGAQNLARAGEGRAASASRRAAGALCDLPRRHAAAEQLVKLTAAGADVAPPLLRLQQLQRGGGRCWLSELRTESCPRAPGSASCRAISRLLLSRSTASASSCVRSVSGGREGVSGGAAAARVAAPRARSTGPIFSRSPRVMKPAASSFCGAG